MDETAVPDPKPALDPAKLRLFRCMNAKCAPKPGRLGFDFVVERRDQTPTCPKCGRTAESPKLALTRLTLIHFDPPEDYENDVHHNHRACDTSVSIMSKRRKDGEPDPWHGGTGSVLAVTCPVCKETQAYKDTVEASRA